MTVYPVILAGGKGTRLWPLSRADRPKQFLSLFGGRSLFQQTLARHASLPGIAAPWVLCSEDYRFMVRDEVARAGLSDGTIVLEPAGRNTAPAIAAAAALIARDDPDGVLFVLPSDHLVTPDDGYVATLRSAFAAAEAGRMVTFGVNPTYPETGYGYIEAGTALHCSGGRVRDVERFVEKPPVEDAVRMLASGTHFWNAGFFAFGAASLLAELDAHAPGVANAARAAAASTRSDLGFLRLGDAAYAAAPDISIDYALFERTTKAAVAPITCPWSDVGSWRALWETSEHDALENGSDRNAVLIDTAGSLVMSEGPKIVTIGVNGLAVIATADAVLVCDLERTQDVRQAVAALKARGDSDLVDRSRTCLRPWGGYTGIHTGERFQVKHLFVLPGKALSLQKHHHRAEHWVVVRGTAEVTIDDTVTTVFENESIYLPIGSTHRLANPGRIMLDVIEVQTGSYLEEDDIVRFRDDFGRS